MKKSLKKKFLDILFEEEGYEKKKVNRKLNDDSFNEPVILKKTGKNTVDAKNVLYHKPNGSAFIDLDEKPAENSNNDFIAKEKPRKDYEFTSQISPIFGMVKEKKKNFKNTKEIDDSLTSKPDTSHLDIITSPIYGYGPQDESNYIPSDTSFLPFDEQEQHVYSGNEEFENLMDYVDQEDENNQEYEELDETKDEQEEYMGYYQSDNDQSSDEYEDIEEERDIPYYDSDVLSEDVDVEEISLFDVEEDE